MTIKEAEQIGSQATPDDICNGALKHYEELTNKSHVYLSTIIHAIETHRKFLKGKLVEPCNCHIIRDSAVRRVEEQQKIITELEAKLSTPTCSICHGVGSKLGFERDGESHEVKCENCKGTGDDPYDNRINCFKCDGTGYVEKERPSKCIHERDPLSRGDGMSLER